MPTYENVKYLTLPQQVEKNRTDIEQLKQSGGGDGTVDWEDIENKPELQDKLVAGTNITINPTTNVISATGEISGTVDWQDVENKPELYTKSEIDLMIGDIPSGGGGELVVESWTTENKTLALSDANKLFLCARTAGTRNQTLTIPTNASVSFPIGTIITFSLTSSNKVTFSPASGLISLFSIDSLVELATQYAMASLIKTDTNVWQLVGALE